MVDPYNADNVIPVMFTVTVDADDPEYPVHAYLTDPPTYIEMGSDMENVMVSFIGFTTYRLANVLGLV